MNQELEVQKEIEKGASLLRSTLESTADGILVVDNQGKIVSFNKRFVSMWHIPEDILATQDDNKAIEFVLKQLVDPDKFLAKVKELYGHPDAESYDTLEFSDGRTFERYSQPQRLGDQSIGRVWSFRDVTEHRRLETEKASQAGQLEKLNSYLVSRELRMAELKNEIDSLKARLDAQEKDKH